jgi:DNA (cytosine-5)-methyltransferase 1
MLKTLGDVGYTVEWRLVNAAAYGFPQRRIRVFIVAYKNNTFGEIKDPVEVIASNGILARALPVRSNNLTSLPIDLEEDVERISKYFNKGKGKKSPFLNSGVYHKGVAYTIQTESLENHSGKLTLGDVLEDEHNIDESFFIPQNQLTEWKFLKGAKSIERIHKGSGTKYNYSEGSMAFPDLLTNPSRTILTGEGGTSPSRFKHIIKTHRGYRRLTPIELERLNGFPDDWTKYDSAGHEVSPTKRAFFMGNALVIGLITKVGKVLAEEMRK